MALSTYDLAVIGGGLAGCAVARDAAGRGMSVFLCDRGDLAGGATSNSGRTTLDGLLHGRPRFRLLASLRARAEEAALLRDAPHLLRPLTLVMPGHSARGRLRRLALSAHGRVRSGKVLPPSTVIRLAGHEAGQVLKAGFRGARQFSACLVDDARLAILNASDARARGAEIRPRTRCVEARREGWFWKITLESVETGAQWKIVARALVNAAGGYAGELLGTVIPDVSRPEVTLVRSSYIITARKAGGDRGYVLTAGDGRLVFAVPIGGGFTLIGPSEVGHAGDPGLAAASGADIDYLTEAVNFWLREPVGTDDVAWTAAAVRVVRVGREAGRGHPFAGDMERDTPEDIAPLVSVFDVATFGHRVMAEAAVDAFAQHVAMGPRWTRGTPLPGGHFAVDGTADLVRALRAAYPFVPEADATRMVAAYGTRAPTILTGARRAEDLGHRFGGGLTEAEVGYLMREEWARTATDVLWRRSSLGLSVSAADASTLDLWMARARQPVAAPAA
ncbi:MAG: glycerol-3-phosphate dehydrogenase [Bauldia sp.]